MSIIRAPKDQAPPNAVRLSEKEVYERQLEALDSYYPEKEVYVLKYGGVLLGATTAISGFFIVKCFRSYFMLKNLGQISSYLPSTMIPAIGIYSGFNLAVQEAILLEKDICPVCLEMRAVSLQVAAGILWPFCLGALSSITIATRMKAIHVPFILSDYKGFFKFLYDASKSGHRVFAGITAIQIAASAFVTYQSGKEYIQFRRRCVIRDELKNF